MSAPSSKFSPAQRSALDCKIQSHSFICEGVTIEEQVFVGHGVVFVNDAYPRATTEAGDLKDGGDWESEARW